MSEIESILLFSIGISLATYFTVNLVESLKNKRDSFLSKLWRWIGNVYDVLSGIG